MEQLKKEKKDNKQWMALYVRSRNEKKVEQRLLLEGIEAYAPVQEVKRQWSDRVKKVKVPVIPSYVFVRTEERERMQILQDPAVMNFVFWLGKPAIIRDEEINRIKFILKEKDLEEEIKFEQLEPGELVQIKSGAFAGEEAQVVEDRKSEVTVILPSLGAKLTVSKIVLG